VEFRTLKMVRHFFLLLLLRWLEIGEELAETCHESYTRTETGLGPDYFWFTHGAEAQGLGGNDKSVHVSPFFFL
jgi:hypothetical protein